MTLDLDAARAYARRQSADHGHARLLASLAPKARPPLDLAPIRAWQAALAQAEAARARPVNVQAARRQPLPPRAPEVPPDAPAGALWAVGRDNRWHWAHVAPDLGGDRWGGFALGLATAGPLVSLAAGTGPCGGRRGQTEIRQGDAGELWAVVTIDPAEAGPLPAGETLRHELAHIADELARLRTVKSVTAWRSEFSRRTDDAERFAVGAESWLDPQMRAADVIARAQAHQDQRARWRGRGR